MLKDALVDLKKSVELGPKLCWSGEWHKKKLSIKVTLSKELLQTEPTELVQHLTRMIPRCLPGISVELGGGLEHTGWLCLSAALVSIPPEEELEEVAEERDV